MKMIPTIFELTSRCGPDCPDFVEKWQEWWRGQVEHPIALIDCANYEPPGAKTRNMVKGARRTYNYRQFKFNQQLYEIEDINTSKPIRSGGRMKGWYTQPLEPTTEAQLCHDHRDMWLGAYRFGKLVAYCHLEKLDGLGIINSILGHKQAAGAVNGLIDFMATQLKLDWLHYLSLSSSPKSLADFKRHCGFKEYLVEGSTLTQRC